MAGALLDLSSHPHDDNPQGYHATIARSIQHGDSNDTVKIGDTTLLPEKP
jgi:hypothetical protein